MNITDFNNQIDIVTLRYNSALTDRDRLNALADSLLLIRMYLDKLPIDDMLKSGIDADLFTAYHRLNIADCRINNELIKH